MEAAGELNKRRIRAEGTGEIRLGNISAMMLSHGCDKVQLKPGSQEEHCVHVSHKQPGGKATCESSLFTTSGTCLQPALGEVGAGEGLHTQVPSLRDTVSFGEQRSSIAQ